MSTNVTNIELAAARTHVQSVLAGMVLEALFCGANVVVYSSGTWMLLSRKWPHLLSKRDIVFLCASTCMFALAIWHIATDLSILVHGGVAKGLDLISLSNGLKTFGSPRSIGFAWQFIYVSQTLITDGFMIYRAFVVWRTSWRVIALPLTLLISEVAFGYAIVAFGRLGFPIGPYRTCRRVFFVMTVVTNLLATGLILYPILVPRRFAREYRPEGSALRTVRWRVMGSILQTAAIFTIASVSFTIMQFVSPTGFALCHYMFPSIVSLVFSLTVTRISLASGTDTPRPRGSLFGARAHSQSCPSLPLPATATATTDGDMRETDATADGANGDRLRPIAIHVSVTTTRSTDRESLASFDVDCAAEKEGDPGSEVILLSPERRD